MRTISAISSEQARSAGTRPPKPRHRPVAQPLQIIRGSVGHATGNFGDGRPAIRWGADRGSFSYEKRLATGAIVVRKVPVLALEVRQQSRNWPERYEREMNRYGRRGPSASALRASANNSSLTRGRFLFCAGACGTLPGLPSPAGIVKARVVNLSPQRREVARRCRETLPSCITQNGTG
jgi:hypothetical protein